MDIRQDVGCSITPSNRKLSSRSVCRILLTINLIFLTRLSQTNDYVNENNLLTGSAMKPQV